MMVKIGQERRFQPLPICGCVINVKTPTSRNNTVSYANRSTYSMLTLRIAMIRSGFAATAVKNGCTPNARLRQAISQKN